jgi:hypothetical protein
VLRRAQPRHGHPGRDPGATWRCDLPGLHGIHGGDGRRGDVRPADRGGPAGDPTVPPRVRGDGGARCGRARPGSGPGRLPAARARRRRVGAELPRLRQVRRARPVRAFNVAAGGVVCPVCRPPGSAAPAPETLRLLSALLTGDWVLADAATPVHQREGSGLVAAFLQWHLERGVRSLNHVERGPSPDRDLGLMLPTDLSDRSWPGPSRSHLTVDRCSPRRTGRERSVARP